MCSQKVIKRCNISINSLYLFKNGIDYLDNINLKKKNHFPNNTADLISDKAAGYHYNLTNNLPNLLSFIP